MSARLTNWSWLVASAWLTGCGPTEDVDVANTQAAGLHHLVYEIVYNSVDEALGGFCNLITVTIHVDGSVSVADNGRGIPIGIKESGKSTLEEALTIAGTSV